jgi:hypothetical protein
MARNLAVLVWMWLAFLPGLPEFAQAIHHGKKIAFATYA